MFEGFSHEADAVAQVRGRRGPQSSRIHENILFFKTVLPFDFVFEILIFENIFEGGG